MTQEAASREPQATKQKTGENILPGNDFDKIDETD
jgi:hypothetical protein